MFQSIKLQWKLKSANFKDKLTFFSFAFNEEYMIKVPGLNIIRVYSDRKEQAEFPIPNKRQTLKQSTDDGTGIPEKLKNVSLHHIIRKYPCPYANELEMYENKFEYDRKESERTSKKEVIAYCQVSTQATTLLVESRCF